MTEVVAQQVAEERALAGMCGLASCPNALNVAKPKGMYKIDAARQTVYKDGDIHFCRWRPGLACLHVQRGKHSCPSVLDLYYLAMRSCACEDVAQRLASKLGSSDAALQRFAAAAPAAQDREACSGAKQPPRFAAGSPDNPIMLSEVKVAYVALV